MAAVLHLGGAGDTANTLGHTTASMSPTTGDLLVAFVYCGASTDTTSTFTESAGGGTYTQAVTGLFQGTGSTMFIFIANQLCASGTARTFTHTLPADSPTGAIISVERVTGMTLTGTAAVKQALAPKGGAGTTPSIAFATVDTNNPTIISQAAADNPLTATLPGGWTSLATPSYATPTLNGVIAGRDSGYSGTTVSWTGTETAAWGALGIELDASGAAAATSLLWTSPPTRYLPLGGGF